MQVDATLWGCSPQDPSCRASREPPLEIPAASARSQEFQNSNGDHGNDPNVTVIPIQFHPVGSSGLGGFDPFINPPSPSNPPPNPFRPGEPIHPPLRPPVRPPSALCNLTRVKTKLGPGGTITADFVLNGVVQSNVPRITLDKRVKVRLDPQTNFILPLLGGRELGWFLGLQLERKLENVIREQSRIIPDAITLPQGPPEPLVWQTKSAQFDAKPYCRAGRVCIPSVFLHGSASLTERVPAFVVTREYVTRPDTACYLRSQFMALR
jgi:hypothetical protein